MAKKGNGHPKEGLTRPGRRHAALKAEAQAGEDGGARHRDEADLVVAVGVCVAVGLADGGIYPTGGGDAGVEYVVDINADGDLPQEAVELDRIVEA